MSGDGTGGNGGPGFTLVEALVALVILSMTMLAALESTSLALRTQHDAARHREAAAVAEWKLNQLAAMTADSLRTYVMAQRGEVTLDRVGYRWSALARPRPEGPRLWEAAVVVEWQDGRVALETLLYRRSPPTWSGP